MSGYTIDADIDISMWLSQLALVDSRYVTLDSLLSSDFYPTEREITMSLCSGVSTIESLEASEQGIKPGASWWCCHQQIQEHKEDV